MVVIGGDLNGHVGKQVDQYDSVHLKHRGWTYSRNGHCFRYDSLQYLVSEKKQNMVVEQGCGPSNKAKATAVERVEEKYLYRALLRS